MNEVSKNYIIFFKKFVILLLVMIAIDLLLGKLLAHFYFKMKTGESSRITYAMTKANEEIIVFGSSRANHNYVPDILEDSFHLKAYNAGIDGQSILFHYCILKNIQLRTKPRIIILDLKVDEFEKSELAYNRLYALLPYYTVCKNIQPIVNLRSPYESVKSLSNLYRYNSFILPVILNNILSRTDDSKKGYVPLNKSLDSNLLLLSARKKNIILDTVKVNIFRSFIKEAKELNGNVFVFISPIYQKNSTITSTIATAEKICSEENILFINYCETPFFNDHPEYFQDIFHLNNHGAKIFTHMISDAIKNNAQ